MRIWWLTIPATIPQASSSITRVPWLIVELSSGSTGALWGCVRKWAPSAVYSAAATAPVKMQSLTSSRRVERMMKTK